MRRNTITTLGNLRTGDRFCLPGKTNVWQVVNGFGKSKTAFNEFVQGKRVKKFDEIKSNRLQVKFLRHTVFDFGDDCLIEELQPGDVFTGLDDNMVDRYLVEAQWAQFTMCSPAAGGDSFCTDHGTPVSFLNKTNEEAAK